MELLKNLGYTATILLIINTILYIKALRNGGKAFKIFTLYLILILIIEILSKIIGPFLHYNNIYLSNIFLIVQFSMLSIFYKVLLDKKWIYYIGVAVLAFLAIQYLTNLDLFTKYNALGISLTQSILITYSIMYFYNSLQRKEPKFLIVNIGVFLYLICSTLIFASGNLVFNIEIPTETYILLLKLNAFLYIIFQILIFTEWRKNYYKKIHK
ncbi:hypothetical protein [Aquimarina sp. 2201CG14-23]|uniref:hypothetical protein n=1 Tax=Aquimarina mycalae TaxID=3040073 RepID=UPI0024780D71|nr:hypothetical protein [Aquimarina sp. 2201CG14-23]MDH7446723.1 hypothetical protein [Aquimarina sp. 2201CG14-23]